MAKSTRSGFAWYRIRRSLGSGLTYLILLLGASVMVVPFLWMISTSVMTLGEANSGRLLPRVARVTCPHVNVSKSDTGGTVTDFAVSPRVRAPEQELHTDSYYVEVQKSSEWQFRLVNSRAEPVAIAPVDQPQGTLTEDWQPIPEPGGEVDTGRGLSLTFAPPSAYPADYAVDRRSGAARTDYVNCCAYPTSVAEKRDADRGERVYSGRPIPEDLSNCRTPGRQIAYFFFEFIGGNYYTAWITANFRD